MTKKTFTGKFKYFCGILFVLGFFEGIGQSNVAIRTGLSRLNLAYSRAVSADSRHWLEGSFIVNNVYSSEYLAFNPTTIYHLEALYQYSFFGFGKNDLLMGLGYRTPEGVNEMYYEYGMLSIPITYERRFKNKPIILSLRANSLLGTIPFVVVPTIGLSYRLN